MSDTNLGKTESCTNYNSIAEWKCWCRLCAKPNAQYINALSGQCVPSSFNIYNSINIVAVLAEFFQLHIKEDEKLSPLICTECYNVVKSLVDFSANIRKVQEFYDDLLHSDNKMKIDFSALYEKHGLFNKETFAPQISTELPVEEVFIADSHAESASQTSKFKIKNETLTEALSPEALIKEFEKEEEIQDPIAEENLLSGMEGSIKASKNNNCSDNDDYDMQTDSWMMLEDERSPQNRLNNENIESEDSEEITKESKYTCNICSQSFQRSGNYAAHMIKKHEKIICPHCPGSFDSESNLKRHMKEHRELYPCKQCDRKFQRKEYVTQHVKCVHNGERPFICEACGDALRSKGQLKEHMLTHTDYSPFECKECGKCFKQKQRLKRHMQIHGDKLICNECGKQLSCRATYNSHMLVHSDKMQHKCDYCGRAFKRAKTLKNHLILHSGLKPYSCEFCDRTFTNGSNRRTHMKRTHPNELAELEATGEKMYTKNIPELAVLKSVIRRDENLIPVVSKQSGNFAFGKKPKAKAVNTAKTTNSELKN